MNNTSASYGIRSEKDRPIKDLIKELSNLSQRPGISEVISRMVYPDTIIKNPATKSTLLGSTTLHTHMQHRTDYWPST